MGPQLTVKFGWSLEINEPLVSLIRTENIMNTNTVIQI